MPTRPWRFRMRGHRGAAIECALVAFLVTFASLNVLFVVTTSVTRH